MIKHKIVFMNYTQFWPNKTYKYSLIKHFLQTVEIISTIRFDSALDNNNYSHTRMTKLMLLSTDRILTVFMNMLKLCNIK